MHQIRLSSEDAWVLSQVLGQWGALELITAVRHYQGTPQIEMTETGLREAIRYLRQSSQLVQAMGLETQAGRLLWTLRQFLPVE